MEKLYIGLVDTPGLFAWMIRKAIRQDYIHVVLGMDEMLDDMAWCGVLVSDGRAFHAEHHVRINFACPRLTVEQMMERLDIYVFNKK